MFNNNSSNEFLQNTKIPVFVGTILNTFVFGTNLGLLINYGKLYRRSSLVFHLPIIFLILISICFTSICQYAVWIWYIDISFLSIDQSSFNSKLDVNVENVNNNHFVIINNVENKDLIIWPYAISPIFTGFLIWGVQCRSMEILSIKDFKKTYSKLYIYPFWLITLTISNLLISTLKFYLLYNRFQSLNEYYNFKFNSLNNNKNLLANTHFFTSNG
ncbi:expressed protein [Phakopsora pachyrhizi]|uniref:Expressed protein n=1 Tax=Phakopsora pachyrhizi TaxID=170000 RepID=A0AAV0BKQ7_PHAPC|nr:expressed protein [Phakopsora pachyrhizi]